MNDAQILAFNLTMLAVYLAPELQPLTRQCLALVWVGASLFTAAHIVF